MTAPSIEMIVESLKNCSLGRRSTGGGARGRDSPSPSPTPPAPVPLPAPEQDELTDESECVAVELNSEIRLPCDWEQYLDLMTGELYYINWKTGMKTSDDPRFFTYDYSSISSSDAATSDDDDDTHDTACSSGASSCSSTSASEEILVAAGCKACFMYFMVPKRLGECPKCGGALLHLGGGGF